MNEPIDEMSEQNIMNELANIIADTKRKVTDKPLVASLDRAKELVDAICNSAYGLLGTESTQ